MWACGTGDLYFNPRSPWGERPGMRAGLPRMCSFQSTLPVGGATGELLLVTMFGIPFQSTLPVGGATAGRQDYRLHEQHFNPRSPWGERLLCNLQTSCKIYFNPRSPWGERQSDGAILPPSMVFQSTLPVGGATLTGISWRIPAGTFQSTLPVGGATGLASRGQVRGIYFNPRSPWGERRRR